MVQHSYGCSLQSDRVVIKRNNGNETITITFERTIRVPDTKKNNYLPPSLGPFPLYKVKDYVKKLPEQMAAKGGLFFPMYRRYCTKLLVVKLTSN